MSTYLGAISDCLEVLLYKVFLLTPRMLAILVLVKPIVTSLLTSTVSNSSAGLPLVGELAETSGNSAIFIGT